MRYNITMRDVVLGKIEDREKKSGGEVVSRTEYAEIMWLGGSISVPVSKKLDMKLPNAGTEGTAIISGQFEDRAVHLKQRDVSFVASSFGDLQLESFSK